jgi:hypothetical protein
MFFINVGHALFVDEPRRFDALPGECIRRRKRFTLRRGPVDALTPTMSSGSTCLRSGGPAVAICPEPRWD